MTDCGNTTNLSKHLRSRHPMVALQSEGTQEPAKKPRTEQLTLEETTQRSLKYPKDSQKQKMLTEKLTSMIVKDMQPFSVVENDGFRDFVNALDPRFNIPSRMTLSKNYLQNLYAGEIKKLKMDLAAAEYIALTTDGWTSRQTTSFLTVTCHYITSEWELRSAVLNTVHLKMDHSAQNLADELSLICNQWDISNKIVAIVTDGANNIVAAVKVLG